MSYFSQTWWCLLCNPSTWKAGAGLSLACYTARYYIKNLFKVLSEETTYGQSLFHQSASFLKTYIVGGVQQYSEATQITGGGHFGHGKQRFLSSLVTVSVVQ